MYFEVLRNASIGHDARACCTPVWSSQWVQIAWNGNYIATLLAEALEELDRSKLIWPQFMILFFSGCRVWNPQCGCICCLPIVLFSIAYRCLLSIACSLPACRWLQAASDRSELFEFVRCVRFGSYIISIRAREWTCESHKLLVLDL